MRVPPEAPSTGPGVATCAGGGRMRTRVGAMAADRRSRLVLIVLSLGQFMSLLDTTAVNVTLPSIQHELHMSAVSVGWVMNAYLVTFGACLLVSGRLGDLVGRKQVFLVGLLVFTASSFACGLATTSAMLVAARFVQGIGAALECAMILGIIVDLFPDPAERDRAIGVYAFLGAAGGSIGLLVGGVITASIGWHWIFFLNVPIGVAAMGSGAVLIERREGLGISEGVDVAGALMITAAAMLAVTGFVEASSDGWGAPVTLGPLLGAIALSAGFLVLEGHLERPLVPMRVLRSRNLLCAGLSRAMFCFGSYGSFFLLVLYLQQVVGYGALGNGLAFLPNTLILSVFALVVTPWLAARVGSKPVHVAGLTAFACGLALLVFLPVHGSFWTAVFPAMLVLGTGGGVFTVANATIGMAESDSTDSGLVSGVINVSQQLGAALGIAVLASVSTLRTSSLIADGVGHDAAVVGGFHVGFGVAIGALCIGIVSGLIARGTPAAGKVEAIATFTIPDAEAL